MITVEDLRFAYPGSASATLDGVTFTAMPTQDSKAILNAVAVKDQLVLVTEAGIRTLAIKKPE